MATNITINPAKTLFTCKFTDDHSYILSMEHHNVNSYYLTNDNFRGVLDKAISMGSIKHVTLSKEEVYALLLLASNGLLEFTLNGIKFSKDMLFPDFNLAKEKNDNNDASEFNNIIYKNNFPFSVKLEITCLCNLKCKYCYMNGTDNTTADRERWIGILRRLRELGVTRLEITGGEPLLYADLPIIIESADSLGFDTTICTNGTLIDESFINILKKLRRVDLRISFHSIDRSTFEKFAGSKDSYNKVIKSIQMLSDEDVPFSVLTVLTSINESTIYNTINYLSSNSIRYAISPYIFPNIFSSGNNIDFRPSKEIIDKLTKDGYISKKCSLCGALKTKFWISCNGDIFPCEMYRDIKISNIFDEDLREIWHSSIMDKLRNKLTLKELDCNICVHNPYCNYCPALCKTFHR